MFERLTLPCKGLRVLAMKLTNQSSADCHCHCLLHPCIGHWRDEWASEHWTGDDIKDGHHVSTSKDEPEISWGKKKSAAFLRWWRHVKGNLLSGNQTVMTWFHFPTRSNQSSAVKQSVSPPPVGGQIIKPTLLREKCFKHAVFNPLLRI